MAQQEQAALVGPLEVVEDQDDRLVCAEVAVSRPTTAANSRNRSVSASVAFVGGRSGRRLASAGTSRASSDPWASTWASELVLGSMGDVVAEGLGEELVRGGQVLLAVAEQHAGALGEGRPGRLGHQGGLAQTRPHPRRAAPRGPSPAGTALGRIGDRRQLGLSARPRRRRARTARRPGKRHGRGVGSPPRGSHSTSTASTGSGRPFSASSPTGLGTRGGCADRPWPAPRRRPGPGRSARAHSRAASTTGSPK